MQWSYLMRWWITMGSGGARSVWRRRGISVNFIRGTSKIYTRKHSIIQNPWDCHPPRHTCWKYLSLLMYSLSVGSCSLLLRIYCQTALIMSGRLAVWMPRSLASLLVSLYCTGWEEEGIGRCVCVWGQRAQDIL